MAITDYNKVKKISPTTQNDSGSTQDKAQPILLVDGDDSTTGTGDIVIDFTNISDAEDIAVYDQNGNLLDYEIESLDTTAETGVIWCYNSWTRDDTVQAQIAYGDNSANTDRQNITASWNNTGQNAAMVQHLQDDPLTATDSTSNDNDGTVNGAVSTTGEFDSAGDFDGADDDIEVADNASLKFGAANFSMTCWIKTTLNPSEFKFIAGKSEDGGTYSAYSLELNTDGAAQFHVRQDSENNFRVVSNTAINDGNWHRLTGVRQNGEIKIFVDAVLEKTLSINTSTDTDSTDPFHIGSNRAGDPRYIEATIDEVKVYSEARSDSSIQAEYDASPKAGQVYFSQQAAEPIATDKTASIPVTQNTQTTPDPQVQAGTVTVSTPTTVLTQTTENPQLQAGATSLTIQETQLTATNPDINLEPGVSRIQVTPTALTQTTENPAVNATFDLSVPETQLTATNPDPSVTLADIVLVPETQLDQTTPDIQVQPGDSPITVPETQLTATNPEISLNRRIVFGVVTQLNATNPEPSLEPGIVQVNIPETQLTQTTENPQVEPGEATVQVTPPTDLTVFTPDIQVTPGNTDLQIDETQLIQSTPELNLGLDLQFVSPTNALITNKNRYFDMPDHTFKQNDFGDTFTATLKDEDNPDGVSIQGNTRVNLVVETFDGEKVLDKEMTVTDAQNGKVEYVWEEGDFIEDIGVYKAEIKVFDAADEPETFPNQGYRSVTVEDELE